MNLATICREASKAAKLTQREEDLEQITADYTDGIGDIFRTQGAMFAAGLEKYRNRFSESIRRLSEQDEPGPVDDVWLQVWADVSRGTSPAIAEEFAESVSVALETGGEATVASIGLTINWELTNPAVIDYLEREAARHVKNVDDETISLLRALIRDASRERVSYSELASRIISRFEYMATTAPQTHIRSRAELIAVTELGNAYEEAGMIVGRDLEADGIRMLKRWNNRGDSRVSDGCVENGDAGAIPLKDNWPATDGTYDRQRPLRFPGCRCWQTMEVDPKFLADAKAKYGAR